MNVTYESLYIGGEWVKPSAATRIDVFSASTEEPIGSVPEAQEPDRSEEHTSELQVTSASRMPSSA